MIVIVVIVVSLAAVGSLVLTPFAELLAIKFDAVSRPDKTRRKHARPTPQWGGAAVYLGLVLSIAASYYYGLEGFSSLSLPIAMALSAGLLCLLGGYDDMADIRARWKMFWQIVAILPIVFAGFYVEQFTLFGSTFELGWFGIVCTMAWLILGINALNLIDGMDGLASMIGIVISIAVAVIAGYQGQTAVMMTALALGGALAGFVVYNLPPARIYLGDCGSMVVGFILALLVLQVSLGGTQNANVMVIAVLFFVPLLDTGLAVIRRTLNGRNFMVADCAHVHHRLLKRGFSVWSVLAFLGGLCLLTGMAAWLMVVTSHSLLVLGALGALSLVLVNRRLVGHKEWATAKRLLAQVSLRMGRRLTPLKRLGRLRTSTPTFTWRIVRGNQETTETVQTASSMQDSNAWEVTEKKAA